MRETVFRRSIGDPLNKNRNSQVCLTCKTKPIYSTQSNDGSEDSMGTVSFPNRTLCLTLEVANGDT